MKLIQIILTLLLVPFAIGQNNLSTCDTVSSSIHFDTGKFAIKPEAEDYLQKVIRDLKEKDITSIQLVGHTDPHGSVEYNQNLSKQRVESVENYILDYVDIEINTGFFGKSKLLYETSTKKNDSLNRRVEILYYINCIETESSLFEKSKNIIYRKDQNCHIDTVLTHQHYQSNLIGEKSSVVVLDWTRSMYSYGLELLKWFNHNKDIANFSEIVIFNDGDGKPTHQKRNGKTGGIYATPLDSIQSAIELMEEVASKGTGGDYPENYIEALFFAQEKYPEADTLFLIADNRACIRDYKMLDSLHKPVVIILNEINPNAKTINYQYLNLAAHTKGRLVFMDQEIKNVSYKEGHTYKPIYFTDTLIKLPKYRGDLDKAYQQISETIKKQKKSSIPPIILIDGVEYDRCFNKKVPLNGYKIGCASCYRLDYPLKTHTQFKERYTLPQKVKIKWRNRPRARFGVIDYKWRKIKCDPCKKIEDKVARKKCLNEKKKCEKNKRSVKNKCNSAKRKLKNYRKKNRISRRRAFVDFFRVRKGGGGGSKGGGSRKSSGGGQ